MSELEHKHKGIVVRRTYDIVTPESAKDGDFAEGGWLTTDGQDWPLGEEDVGDNCGPGSHWHEGREKATLRFDDEEELLQWLKNEGAPIYEPYTANETSFTNEDGMDSYTGESRSTTWHIEAEESDPALLERFHKRRQALMRPLTNHNTSRNGELTEGQVEELVWNDYQTLQGKTLIVSVLDAYKGDDHITMNLDPPVKMRVLPMKPTDNWLQRWMDDVHLDPLYLVEPVESDERLEGLSSMTIYGKTRTIHGASEPCEEWSVQETP